LRLQLQERAAKDLEQKLSPEGATLVRGILEGLTGEQILAFQNILQEHTDEADQLSPERVVMKIDSGTRIYLIHGTTDDAIPYEETLELKQVFQSSEHSVRSLITPALSHVDMKSVAGVWESLKLMNWQRHLLREATAG
jgi:hypothetical protein